MGSFRPAVTMAKSDFMRALIIWPFLENLYTGPASGSIERIKNPGRPGLAGLLIVDAAGYSASIYYVEPTPEIKQKLLHPSPDSQKIKVEAGQTLIGHAQAIHPIYPADVPNHVHVTLTDPNGNPVSPDARMRIKKTPTGR